MEIQLVLGSSVDGGIRDFLDGEKLINKKLKLLVRSPKVGKVDLSRPCGGKLETFEHFAGERVPVFVGDSWMLMRKNVKTTGIQCLSSSGRQTQSELRVRCKGMMPKRIRSRLFRVLPHTEPPYPRAICRHSLTVVQFHQEL